MAISTNAAKSILTGAGTGPVKTTLHTNPPVKPNNTEVACISYYLENTTANHYKFYWILISDLGHMIFTWGRIGSAGQAKVEKFSSFTDAETTAMKQFYAKASKGYVAKEEEKGLKFTVPLHQLDDAIRAGKSDALMVHRRRALQDPAFKGQQQTAARHYDSFIAAAGHLMNRAASQPIETLFDDWQALQESWAELDEKHATAATTLSLTGQMLQAKLAGL